METIQTDSTNYSSSRNRRLTNESHDSESDDDGGLSGFYVRQKKETSVTTSPVENVVTNNVETESDDPLAQKEQETEITQSNIDVDPLLLDNLETECNDPALDVDNVKLNNIECNDEDVLLNDDDVLENKSLEESAECDSSNENGGNDDKMEEKSENSGELEKSDEIIEKIGNEDVEIVSESKKDEENKSREEICENNEESQLSQSEVLMLNDSESVEDIGKDENEENVLNKESPDETLNKEAEIPKKLEETSEKEEAEETPKEEGEIPKKEEEKSKQETTNKEEEATESKQEDDKESSDKKADESVEDTTKKIEESKEIDEKKEDKVENKDVISINNSETESETETKLNDSRDESEKLSFLKEQLLQPRLDAASKPSDSNDPTDMEDMEDLDPSLLCPDISMDVDESPVITNNENGSSMETDGNTSPLLYEPTFSTYVDEMTGAEVSFNLTQEECELRSKIFGPDNLVQYSKIHCTACNVHLGSALDGQKNRFVHPLLKVLICRNCYHFYTSGEFEKDEDGSELYCRWCGQGGQVLCCSTCEFVFCKRCIKNNFGLKKFKEIRESDDWKCFRCEPQQLSILRASCAEFMDYIRTEMARAATLVKDIPSIMTTDYTTCCSRPKEKKKEDAAAPKEAKPRKRRYADMEDPDYNPAMDREPPEQVRVVASGLNSTPTVVPVGQRPLAPKPILVTAASQNVRLPQQTFRVGNTVFRPRSAVFPVTRPVKQGPVRLTGPGYIKIMPGTSTGPPSTITPKPVTFTNLSRMPAKQNVVTPTRVLPSSSSSSKHEWFEKTVRAAARVNSNLSYTLTQLNRQQANASSVEALAVVHNKLQEVLSTSINSLIQIRKNLRTEFIAGIKSIKFPPKQVIAIPKQNPVPQPIRKQKDDDDVIFVSTPPVVVSTPTSIGNIVLPPSVTLKPTTKKPVESSTAGPSTIKKAADNGNNRPGGYIKVKSFSALQKVTSECITIPDDPPPLVLVRRPQGNNENVFEIKDKVVAVNKEKEKSDASDKNDCIEIVDIGSDDNDTSLNLSNSEDKAKVNSMKRVSIMLEKSPQIEKMIEETCNKVDSGGEDSS